MPEHEWVNEAGYGARRKAEELRAQQPSWKRVLAVLFRVHTEERAWRMGAEGEELVGRRLARLPDGWQVLHDLTIGTRGANLDHLVIGPPGVFTINTKYHSGTVTVYDRAILHNGKKTPYIPKALGEATKVQEAISNVVGRPITVRSVLVIVGATVEMRKRPDDVTVLRARRVPRWFKKQKAQVLKPLEVTQLAATACLPQTWHGRTEKQPGRTPATSAVPVVTAEADSVEAGSSDVPGTHVDEPLTTRRWSRFGHDRVYVNDTGNRTLGYLDLTLGTVHVVDPAHESQVRQATASWLPGR